MSVYILYPTKGFVGARDCKLFSCHHITISSYHHIMEARHVVCLKKHMSCVGRKTCRVFEERHVVCSKKDVSCVRRKTCRVFEERHVVCSKKNMSCVQRKTCRVFQTRHIANEKSTCHFLANSAERPRIYANRNQIRLNPGTIGRIRQKMACEIFELRTAQKSRG